MIFRRRAFVDVRSSEFDLPLSPSPCTPAPRASFTGAAMPVPSAELILRFSYHRRSARITGRCLSRATLYFYLRYLLFRLTGRLSYLLIISVCHAAYYDAIYSTSQFCQGRKKFIIIFHSAPPRISASVLYLMRSITGMR